MMRPAITAALAVLLASCAGQLPQGAFSPEPLVTAPPGSPPPLVDPNPVNLTPAQVQAVYAGVRRVLKDPDSAKFGPVIASQAGREMIHVCGTVNARNSYGGYTGPKPFIGAFTEPGRFGVAGMGGTDAETYAVREVCHRHFLTLD